MGVSSRLPVLALVHWTADEFWYLDILVADGSIRLGFRDPVGHPGASDDDDNDDGPLWRRPGDSLNNGDQIIIGKLAHMV